MHFWHLILNHEAKFAQDLMVFLHHYKKLVQLRWHKGAGTQMHKYLVGRALVW
jgi:hypothetical protein